MPRALRVAAAGAGLSVVAYFLYRRWKDGQLAFAPLDYTRSDTWFKRDTHGDKQCDLFYVHPTTVIGLISPNTAPPVGATVLKDTMSGDPDLLENHCGAFAADCNVWAPMYAQAGMLQQVCKVNMDSSPKATPEYEDELIAPLLIAYADIKRAFAAFLASRPDASRPFIVAGHSQGSVLLSKIVRECIDGQPCSSCFVAGYLTGGYVPHDLFGAAGSGGVHNCAGPDDTGCVISYCTRIRGSFVVESLQALGGGYGIWPHMLYWLLHDRYGERPSGTDDVSKPRLEINPATWTEQGGGTYLGAKVAGRDAPLLPPEGGAAYGACVRVTDKAVWVVDPRPWCTNVPAGPAKHGNLHPIDLQFWHFNIKENVPTRIAAWRAKQGVLL